MDTNDTAPANPANDQTPAAGEPAPLQPPPDFDPLTGKLRPPEGCLAECEFSSDVDASIRFAEANKERLRYCSGLGWLSWDGKRWAAGSDGQAVERSKECARRWTEAAWKKYRENSTQESEKAFNRALAKEGGNHINAAASLAKSDPRIVITTDKLDCDHWLLNVKNGTIDLRTGQLRPHRREDFITKLAQVNFRPDARHDVLDRYLATLDATSPGVSAFIARCIGVSLTGDNSTESLFLIQGDAGSGKTTLTEATAAMAGDYAVKLPFDSFCLSKHGRSPGAASPDLAKLRGARFAYASEGDQSAKLDAGVVKTLTGGEPYTARALYQDPVTFAQTWKLWLVSNFDPRVDSEDTGIWRRMVKVPFTAVKPELRDPRLKEALTQDPDCQEALLAWAVRGCKDWQCRGRGRLGLAIPEEVAATTEAYRQKQDSLADWWDDVQQEYTLNPAGSTPASSLRTHYAEWAEGEGVFPVAAPRFNAYLEGKGLQKGKASGGLRVWRGLRPNSPSLATKAV